MEPNEPIRVHLTHLAMTHTGHNATKLRAPEMKFDDNIIAYSKIIFLLT